MPIIIDDGAVLRALDARIIAGLAAQDTNIVLVLGDEQPPTPEANAIVKRGPWVLGGDPVTGADDTDRSTFEVVYEVTLGEQNSVLSMPSACSAVRWVLAKQGWRDGDHVIQVLQVGTADPEGLNVSGRVTVSGVVHRVADTVAREDRVNA